MHRPVVNQDRFDDAVQVLKRLHRHKKDPDSILAHREYLQIMEQHVEEKENKAAWGDM
jgi:hypothetical protein